MPLGLNIFIQILLLLSRSLSATSFILQKIYNSDFSFRKKLKVLSHTEWGNKQTYLDEATFCPKTLHKIKRIYSLGHCECNSWIKHYLTQWDLTADWVTLSKSIYACTLKSLLIHYQVKSRLCNQLLQYSKWLDKFQTLFEFQVIFNKDFFLKKTQQRSN